MRDKAGAIVAILAENVKKGRKDAGLSQEELAFRAGLDRTYISQVERNKRNVTIEVLAKLAKALNVSPDQLLVPVKRTR